MARDLFGSPNGGMRVEPGVIDRHFFKHEDHRVVRNDIDMTHVHQCGFSGIVEKCRDLGHIMHGKDHTENIAHKIIVPCRNEIPVFHGIVSDADQKCCIRIQIVDTVRDGKTVHGIVHYKF